MNKENQNINERRGGLIGCLNRLVSRWRDRKTTWIADYEYTQPLGCWGNQRISKTVKFRRKITATCLAEAFNHAERITAEATPEGLEGDFDVRNANMLEILFG